MDIQGKIENTKYSFQGMSVIITGGGQGLGRAYAKAFAHNGAMVCVADLNSEKAKMVVEEITELGGVAFWMEVDVSEPQSTLEMAKATEQKYGRIDVLVNNAAIFSTLSMKPFFEISNEEWDAVIKVNLNGVFHCSSAVTPVMRQNRWGRIINISSAAVTMGRPNYTHYIASKSALVGMTSSMARELGEFGINVNAIMPGATFTEIDRLTITPQQKINIIKSQCIQRPASPDDLVGPVLFFSSIESKFITGQTLTVDGGATHG
tara:strand:+ start:3107 stop:3895 length:789 start_codon:yes stop_codon:yes gene_type:complete